jgi:hypothetical protein
MPFNNVLRPARFSINFILTQYACSSQQETVDQDVFRVESTGACKIPCSIYTSVYSFKQGDPMKFNIRIIFLGGLLMYIAQWLTSMVAGVFIHEGVLEPLYKSVPEFWRPELNQEPPDMAALMPRWIGTGLAIAFVVAGIYDNIRSAFDGSGAVKGLKFGLVVGLIHSGAAAGYSGIFNLPDTIWVWWGVEAILMYVIGGAVLGWFVDKFAAD